MNQILEVQLFGAFRKYSDSGVIKLERPSGLTVGELRKQLKQSERILHEQMQARQTICRKNSSSTRERAETKKEAL